MTSNEKLMIASAQAEDTFDLLNHIAWTDVIQPALTKYRNDLGTQIAATVLGTVKASPGGSLPTIEQLAGKIHGIDFVTKLLNDIVTNGKRASTTLREAGINLD